ncbi:gag-pol polyprotein [Tanacetum coccineum]
MGEAEASVASHSPSHRVAITWHQKLGHMSEQGIKILVERKLLPGLTKELVHSDVWQAPVLSLGGAKYFVSFIDDYSRRCWVYPFQEDRLLCLKARRNQKAVHNSIHSLTEWSGRCGIMTDLVRKSYAPMVGNCKAWRKSFWAEEAELIRVLYDNNHSPLTAVELKTPMEMWTGKPVNYSDLHIFGSPVYVMYNSQETTKLDPKSRKCLFLGYADGVKGYRLWDLTAHKVVVSRDVVFMEDKIQENEEGDSTTKETTSIQMENEFQSNDSFEAVPQHEVNETTESQAPTTRTSNRERKCPVWQSDYVMESNVAYCLLTEEGEPSNLQEALNNPDASFWKEAMQEELEALHKNKTWELVPLPGGRKPIGNK